MMRILVEVGVWVLFVGVTIFVAVCVNAFIEGADSCGDDTE